MLRFRIVERSFQRRLGLERYNFARCVINSGLWEEKVNVLGRSTFLFLFLVVLLVLGLRSNQAGPRGVFNTGNPDKPRFSCAGMTVRKKPQLNLITSRNLSILRRGESRLTGKSAVCYPVHSSSARLFRAYFPAASQSCSPTKLT